MAKKKSRERVLMWVFGSVAAVALVSLVTMFFGSGASGQATSWSKWGVLPTRTIEQPQSSFVVPFQSATTSADNSIVSVQTEDGLTHTTGVVRAPAGECKLVGSRTGYGLEWVECKLVGSRSGYGLVWVE